MCAQSLPRCPLDNVSARVGRTGGRGVLNLSPIAQRDDLETREPARKQKRRPSKRSRASPRLASAGRRKADELILGKSRTDLTASSFVKPPQPLWLSKDKGSSINFRHKLKAHKQARLSLKAMSHDGTRLSASASRNISLP